MGKVDAKMGETILYQLLIVCVIGLIFTIEGSAGSSISPSLVAFPPLTPLDGMHAPVQQIGSFNSVAPSSESHPNGSSGQPNITSPPPAVSGGTISSISPSSSSAYPSHTTVPPPVISQGPALSVPPTPPEAMAPVHTTAPPLVISQGPALRVPPTPPEAVAPVHTTAPPPVISRGPALPVPLIPPEAKASVHTTAPPPIISQGPALPVPPTPPEAMAPVHTTAPPPVISQGPALPVPLIPPEAKAPVHTTAPPPVISQGPALPVPPTPPEAMAPVHTTAPPPVISQGPALPVPLIPPEAKAPVHTTAPPPVISQGPALPVPPTPPEAMAPVHTTAPPAVISQGPALPVPPIPPEAKAPISMPTTPAASPSDNLPPRSSVIQPSTPPSPPPNSDQNNTSSHGAPFAGAVSPVAPRPEKSEQVAPAVHQTAPPPMLPTSPGGSPPSSLPTYPRLPGESPSQSPDNSPNITLPPHSASPESIDPKPGATPLAAPPPAQPPVNHSPNNGSSAIAPSTHKSIRHSDAPVPSHSSIESPASKVGNSPASTPPSSPHKHKYSRDRVNDPAPAPSNSYLIPPPKQQGSEMSPSTLPTRQMHHAAPPFKSGELGPSSATSFPQFPTPPNGTKLVPSPSPTPSAGWESMPVNSPKVSPSRSSPSPKAHLPPPIFTLPPPPPNQDCSSTICTDPYTNSPPGSPCACVLPMQVGLRLSVDLYTFFPLVSELALEIAGGVFMKQSQVKIMGANAASPQPDKTIVLLDLVPLGERFDNTTAFLTSERFWHKQILIKPSYFGDYDVLYVRYPGLPPSPPMAPSDMTIVDGSPYPGNDDGGRKIKPIGVDVRKRQDKGGLGAGAIAIISLSAFVGLVLFVASAWVMIVRRRKQASEPASSQQAVPTPVTKRSGTAGSVIGSSLSSASMSFQSSIVTYAGSAKTFSASEIEKATNNFDDSRIIGEGGFGRVYDGVLEDRTKVAVKVLKREDHHSGREFLAEVEMLSRLHHRNLVQLIGICTEEHARCLVYELIPNGSVESHLHGPDKDTSPLDWDARIKIALGSARGLAYLHEDSSPRVIHRDFKASNILVEHDFTPKVSDFGLARNAMDEENRHISTRVMGTFGYVAPEYAMTGHLLVKSDVYSYGVVLLELLTGRKPVDMTQPPGRENLVAWARPLLTSREGLEELIDPSLGPDVSFDSVAKVAAIASMCVQPEVSHRPFMGEVVQALKLVCNECDEANNIHSESFSHELSAAMDPGVGAGSGHLLDPFHDHNPAHEYHSEPDVERGLPLSELLGTSASCGKYSSGSFRRYSSSGPLVTGKGRKLWQKMKALRRESVSEHGIMFKSWPGSR